MFKVLLVILAILCIPAIIGLLFATISLLFKLAVIGGLVALGVVAYRKLSGNSRGYSM